MLVKIALRDAAFLLLIVVLSSCASPEKKPKGAPGDWGFLKFAEVRAFRMNWNDPYRTPSIVVHGNRLNSTRIPKTGIPLDAKQVALLRSAITGPRPLPDAYAACFDPHHAFVFYDHLGKVVGHIDICFQCAGYEATPKGFSDELNWKALTTLMKDLGIPIENPKWN